MKIQRILCPIDFSEPSKVAIAAAAGLARTFNAELLALHVIEPVLYPVEYGMAPVPTIDLESQATRNADDQMHQLLRTHAPDVRSRTRVLLGRADDKITDLVGEEGIDLIVMATQGRTGLKHALLGSVAERVVRHATCPVLTIKARKG